MRDSTWWRMAKRKEICAERYVCGRGKGKNSPRNHLFVSKAARKAFKKSETFPVSRTDETSLYTLHRLDAVITHAVDSFRDITEDTRVPNKAHQNDQNTNMEVAVTAAPRNFSRNTGTISHDNVRELRRFLQAAAIRLMNSCSICSKKEQSHQRRILKASSFSN